MSTYSTICQTQASSRSVENNNPKKPLSNNELLPEYFSDEEDIKNYKETESIQTIKK